MLAGEDGPGFRTVAQVVLEALDARGRAAAVRAYRHYRSRYGWIHTAWHLESLAARMHREGRSEQAALVRRLIRISHGRTESR